jgi:hypothetical protein
MIALATADLSAQPFDDIDQPFLEEAFAGRAPAEFVRWDDENVDWAGYDLVVLRSTWDYSARPERFRLWLEHVSAVGRLLNPAGTVAWNLDKRYLGALAAGGVPVSETLYVDDLDAFDAGLASLESGQVVVKPTVSAGSDHTGRFERADPAARELTGRILAGGRRAMLQPYYESVTERGEVAVVHLGGVFSHALTKGPILQLGGTFLGGEYTEEVRAVTPTAAQLEIAEQTLARYRELAASEEVLAGTEPLLYSRIDLIEADDGTPRVLEMELIEPSLFFETDDAAAARFVDAVLARL